MPTASSLKAVPVLFLTFTAAASAMVCRRLPSARCRRRAARVAPERRPAKKVAIIVERVETERCKLQCASAVLLALVYSLDRGLDTEQAGDVAGSALELIE